jgi:PAS domain S-box-containing protein
MAVISQPVTVFDALDYVPVGSCVLDQRLKVVFWNKCLEEWTGVSRDNIVGRSIYELFPRLFGEGNLAEARHVIQYGDKSLQFSFESFHHFVRSPFPNSKWQVFNARVSCIPEGGSEGGYGMLVIQDVTSLASRLEDHKNARELAKKEEQERKLAQAALGRLSQHHELILESVGNGIVGIDCDHNILFINPAGANMLGCVRDKLIGRNLHDMLRHDCPSRWGNRVCGLVAPIPTGVGNRVSEDRFFTQDGLMVPVEYVSTPIQEYGQVVGVVVTFRDITERKNLEKEVFRYTVKLEEEVDVRAKRIRDLEQRRMHVEKLAALAQVAAGVAHEINNPLAGIKNSFQLIKGGISKAHPRYEYVGRIEKEIDRIAGIIQRMYQLYRPGSAPSAVIHLPELLRDVSLMMEKSLGQHGVTLVWDINPNLEEIQLPIQDILQVMCNLVQNAVHASPHGRKVNISVWQTERKTHISIQDYGEGIPSQVLPHIFEPFFTTKMGGAQGGMGLGLSVSRGLIEAMGGEIALETGDGTGTIFTVSVPTVYQVEEECFERTGKETVGCHE